MTVNKITIIGSGLGAVTAARILIENNWRVTLVTTDARILKPKKYGEGLLSARINSKKYSALRHQFLDQNNIKCENFELFGTNELGGLSRVWGAGYILGKTYIAENKINLREKELENYFSMYGKERNSEFARFFLSLSKSEINFSRTKFLKKRGASSFYSAFNDLKVLSRHKNFKLITNVLVARIEELADGTINIFSDQKETPIINTKKLVLAAGTISTTKILLNSYNILNKNIRLMHNPNFAFLGFLKKGMLNRKKTISGEISFNVHNKNNGSIIAAGTMGMISDDIIDVISNSYGLLAATLLNIFLKIFKNFIFVGNCFIDNKLSDCHISSDSGITHVRAKKKGKNKVLEKIIFGQMFNCFKPHCLFFIKKSLPLGSDVHYTGTITKKNHKLFAIQKDYSIKANKNIFVIDGSILTGNPIYPGIFIINNAIDFALKIIIKNAEK